MVSRSNIIWFCRVVFFPASPFTKYVFSSPQCLTNDLPGAYPPCWLDIRTNQQCLKSLTPDKEVHIASYKKRHVNVKYIIGNIVNNMVITMYRVQDGH